LDCEGSNYVYAACTYGPENLVHLLEFQLNIHERLLGTEILLNQSYYDMFFLATAQFPK